MYSADRETDSQVGEMSAVVSLEINAGRRVESRDQSSRSSNHRCVERWLDGKKG